MAAGRQVAGRRISKVLDKKEAPAETSPAKAAKRVGSPQGPRSQPGPLPAAAPKSAAKPAKKVGEPVAKAGATPAGPRTPPPVAPFRVNGAEGVRSMIAGQPSRRLGITIDSVARDRIVATMAIKPAHMNRGQRVNGGVLMAFADFLGAAGTVMNLLPGWRTTTLESKTNFFAAGQGPALTGVSTPLHVGRSTQVWQTRIVNDDGRLVAMVTQTQIVLPPPEKRPAKT